MKANKIIILTTILAVLALQTTIMGQIRLVLGAALTNSYFELRKQQYLEAFRILNKYGYHDFYIVEALKQHGPTFLDNYTKNVFYSTANDPNFKNQGANEGRTLLQGTYHFNFEPEDMIIKLTGRYHLISDYFLKLVENNPGFDALVKMNKHGEVLTLGFAMKCKWFREMYETMDFNSMERNWINVELEVGNYIRKKLLQGNFKVFYVDRLDVKANMLGSSAAPGAKEEILIF